MASRVSGRLLMAAVMMVLVDGNRRPVGRTMKIFLLHAHGQNSRRGALQRQPQHKKNQ